MFTPARITTLALAGSLLLAGCNSADKDKPVPTETDPAMSGALGDQIMVDPDMADGQGAAVDATDRQVTIPPEDRSAQAATDARAQATRLAGGKLMDVPSPASGGAQALTQIAASAAQVAQASRSAHTDCTAKVGYSGTWAAKLPEELPVYPRGAVQEAAGVDEGGCALRVVNYVTPVSPGDIVAFYYTRANKAGYSAEYRMDGSDHVLGGRRQGKAYVVYARKLKDGLTEVDLVTSGR